MLDRGLLTIHGGTDAGAVDIVVVVLEDIVGGVLARGVNHELDLCLVGEAVLEEHVAVVCLAEVAKPVELLHAYASRGGEVAILGLGSGELQLTCIKE